MATTLETIRDKVRRVTARYEPEQLSDAQIDTYINTFDGYDLPEINRNLKLKVPYVFLTLPNVDTYNLPFNDFLTVEPQAWIAGYRLGWFQDDSLFYGRWPKVQQVQQIAVGNGTVGPYTGTIPSIPFLRAQINAAGVVQQSEVLITATNSTQNLIAQDTSFLNNVGTLSGTNIDSVNSFVNYVTGQFQIKYTVVVPNGTVINAQVVPYAPTRPLDILFANYQFTLRPVPDNVYQVQMWAYKKPSDILAGQSPELNEWWQYIAYGAALKVFADFPDPESKAQCREDFEEQKLLVQRRTLKQISNQRANTIFSAPDRGNYFGSILPYSNQ